MSLVRISASGLAYDDQTYKDMARLLPGRRDLFRAGEDMSGHTSFKVGGPADCWIAPTDEDCLREVLQTARANGIRTTVLGRGCNVIVSDEGIRGLVIQLQDCMDEIEIIEPKALYKAIEDNRSVMDALPLTDRTIALRVGAGAKLIQASREALGLGLTGLEFASGIPGSCGGAVFMNAGAYGGAMEGVVGVARYLDEAGEARLAVGDQLDFGYRHSLFRSNNGIITRITFLLLPGDQTQISQLMEDFQKRRESSQPLDYPSAGSVFKRPTGYYAGKLIMDSGLKGTSVGGAQVSTKHAGFIINTGGATAADIHGLIRLVQERVLQDSGVELECEVRTIGP